MDKLATPSNQHVDKSFDEMPSISSSHLVGSMQKATRLVMTHGSVLVTKHDEPSMVLMSVDRYQQLAKSADVDLTAMTSEFDALLAQMQAPAAASKMANAFSLTPAQLGRAAVKAAR